MPLSAPRAMGATRASNSNGKPPFALRGSTRMLKSELPKIPATPESRSDNMVDRYAMMRSSDSARDEAPQQPQPQQQQQQKQTNVGRKPPSLFRKVITRSQSPANLLPSASNASSNSGRKSPAPPAAATTASSAPSATAIATGKATAPPRQKRRVITPEMVARRKMNMTNLPLVMTSKHDSTSSNNSVTASVNTEMTEKVCNRASTVNSRKQTTYVPTLEQVNTFESLCTNGTDVTIIKSDDISAAPVPGPPISKSSPTAAEVQEKFSKTVAAKDALYKNKASSIASSSTQKTEAEAYDSMIKAAANTSATSKQETKSIETAVTTKVTANEFPTPSSNNEMEDESCKGFFLEEVKVKSVPLKKSGSKPKAVRAPKAASAPKKEVKVVEPVAKEGKPSASQALTKESSTVSGSPKKVGNVPPPLETAPKDIEGPLSPLSPMSPRGKEEIEIQLTREEKPEEVVAVPAGEKKISFLNYLMKKPLSEEKNNSRPPSSVAEPSEQKEEKSASDKQDASEMKEQKLTESAPPLIEEKQIDDAVPKVSETVLPEKSSAASVDGVQKDSFFGSLWKTSETEEKVESNPSAAIPEVPVQTVEDKPSKVAAPKESKIAQSAELQKPDTASALKSEPEQSQTELLKKEAPSKEKSHELSKNTSDEKVAPVKVAEPTSPKNENPAPHQITNAETSITVEKKVDNKEDVKTSVVTDEATSGSHLASSEQVSGGSGSGHGSSNGSGKSDSRVGSAESPQDRMESENYNECKKSKPTESNLKVNRKNTKETEKGKKKEVPKAKKKGRGVFSSFLGKKAKVIDEDEKYSDDDVEGPSDEPHEKPISKKVNEKTVKLAEDAMFPEVMENKRVVDEKQYDDDELDIHIQATLSDAEFLSVQSSITTDKEAFASHERFGLIKRTSSLIRNPALPLRRKKSLGRLERDELKKCMKNGESAAKADNRLKEELDDFSVGSEQDDGQQSEVGQSLSKDAEIQCKMSDNTSEEHFNIRKQGTQERGASFVERGVSFVGSEDSSIQQLLTLETFDDTFARGSDGVKHDTQSGISGMPSPSPQQVRFKGVEGGTQTSFFSDGNAQTYPMIRNVSSGLANQVPSRVASVDHSVQTSVEQQQQENVGSFSKIMESMALFSAKVCMGAGASMVTCADSCSDKPHTKSQLLGKNSFIEDEAPQYSKTHNAREQIFRAPCGGDLNYVHVDKETEAAGVLARALAMALHTVGEEEQQKAVSRQNSNSSAPTDGILRRQNSLTQSVTKSFDQSEYGEPSVDGKFIRDGGRRRKKRVPRNIAVKPKKDEEKETTKQKSGGILGGPSELKRVSSAGKCAKKGITAPARKFVQGMKNLTKAKLSIMYEV